jgi:hypothetical protein
MELFVCRRGGAATAVLVFVVASLLVAGGFWYYLSLGDGDSMDLAGEEPGAVEEEEEAQTVEEPVVDGGSGGFSIQDAVDDLEGRGVTVVTVAEVEGYGELGFLVEFSEFVKAAVKMEMVLMCCPEGEAGMLVVPFENAFIVWRPEVRFEDGEPVEESVLVEILSAGCTETDDGWIVCLRVANEGNVVAGIEGVAINGVEVDKYGVVGFGYSDDEVGVGEAGTDAPLDIGVGGEADVHVYISDGYSDLASGTTINIRISCGGMDYIMLARLT